MGDTILTQKEWGGLSSIRSKKRTGGEDSEQRAVPRKLGSTFPQQEWGGSPPLNMGSFHGNIERLGVGIRSKERLERGQSGGGISPTIFAEKIGKEFPSFFTEKEWGGFSLAPSNTEEDSPRAFPERQRRSFSWPELGGPSLGSCHIKQESFRVLVDEEWGGLSCRKNVEDFPRSIKTARGSFRAILGSFLPFPPEPE